MLTEENEKTPTIAPANDVAHGELRAELRQEARTAMSLSLVSVVLNVVSIVAIVGLARGRLGLLTGVAVAAVEFLVVSVAWAVARSAHPRSLSLIRLP